MAKTIYYSEDLKVSISVDYYIKTMLRVKFQKRKYLFFWEEIKTVCFNVYDYWSPFSKEMEERIPVIADHFGNGGEVETWKPDKFNLQERINEHWLNILSKDNEEANIKSIISA